MTTGRPQRRGIRCTSSDDDRKPLSIAYPLKNSASPVPLLTADEYEYGEVFIGSRVWVDFNGEWLAAEVKAETLYGINFVFSDNSVMMIPFEQVWERMRVSKSVPSKPILPDGTAPKKQDRVETSGGGQSTAQEHQHGFFPNLRDSKEGATGVGRKLAEGPQRRELQCNSKLKKRKTAKICYANCKASLTFSQPCDPINQHVEEHTKKPLGNMGQRLDVNPGIADCLWQLRHSATDQQWKEKLIQTAHMGCVMGWDDEGTHLSLEEFALASMVCGKAMHVLTLEEARSKPEWNQWLESMKGEFDALNDMQVFELVKLSDVPKGRHIFKTKFILKRDDSIEKFKSDLTGTVLMVHPFAHPSSAQSARAQRSPVISCKRPNSFEKLNET